MFAAFRNSHIDWILVAALVPLVSAGLVTIGGFGGADGLFLRQFIWVIIAFVVLFAVASFDTSFLKRSGVLLGLYIAGSGLLLALFVAGSTVKGATSWLDFGSFSLQPVDLMKIILILVLAKYFSRRHVEIRHPKHIFVSGLYMFVPFALVMLQPDTGSAIILFAIWFGIVLLAGISKKHLFIMLAIAVVSVVIAWNFVLAPYQQARITTFLNPLSDIQGAGYNAYQSQVAVGSGQVLGKGLGYGTQSRLNFLPEYETDFIFAAFAEEWGFIGTLILIALFGIVIWRLVRMSMMGRSNFEVLFAAGLVIYLMSHITINVGMNIGLFPVTGIPLPFLSHGGSHLFAEFLGIGIAMSMARNAHRVHPEDVRRELIGVDYAR